MKKGLFFVAVFFFGLYAACVSQPPAPPLPVTPTPVFVGDTSSAPLNQIKEIAANSKCAKYDWEDRGTTTKGYYRGMALSFARSLCHKDSPSIVIASQPKTDADKTDALSWYSGQFAELGMKNDVAGPVTLRHVYTLAIGLGMQESSGKYCEGRDEKADNVDSESCEAGLFQTSWDSRYANPELAKIFERYKTEKNCFLEVFSEGVNCSKQNLRNYGSGDGLEFQALSKICPAFAAEYVATMIRVSGGSKGHYGPLRRHAAEVIPACDQMLSQVQALVEKNPSVCSLL